jgi:hypothetical protein
MALDMATALALSTTARTKGIQRSHEDASPPVDFESRHVSHRLLLLPEY